MTFTNLPEQVI